MIKHKIETVYIRLNELMDIVKIMSDNAVTPDETAAALHAIEDILELRLSELQKLIYDTQ